MEDSAEVDVNQKKTKNTNLDSENISDSVKIKSEDEPGKVISNGTGNGIRDSTSEEDIVKETTKTVKITKISKSFKSEPVKDKSNTATGNPSKKGILESPTKSPSTPSGNKPSGSPQDFHGFQEVGESDQQLQRKKAFDKFLNSLENVLEKDEESEEEAMTAEDGDAVDSDSNKMEIDEGNSHADSAEFSDKNDKGRTKDSDVDVMETDSVNSVGNTSDKSEEEGVKAGVGTTAVTESEPKVEYCGTCNDVVDDAEEGICCDGKCERWFHLQCSGLTQAEYDELGRDENAKWACNRCSGKPPPEIKPGSKPLLTVRKDLTAIQTPSPKRKISSKEEKRPRVDISNPIFLKPFDYGWKRELVYRSTVDNQNKKQGDVYYYTPKGKKLRSLREISEHLIGTDLTVDNFTFWKDAIGCDPEKEIIRDAKIKIANKDSPATPSPAAPKKVLTPRTPKTPKATPKLTATVTPLDSASGLPVAKASASVTPRVVLKTGKTGNVSTGPKFKVTPSKATTTPGQAQKIVISKGALKGTSEHQLPKLVTTAKTGHESKKEERNQVFNDNLRISDEVEIEIEGERNQVINDNLRISDEIEIMPKYPFKRYGLLANRISTRNIARKRNSKSSSSSSSDDQLDSERHMKKILVTKTGDIKSASVKSREIDNSQAKKVSIPSPNLLFSGISKPSLTTDKNILPNVRRPRSPEIQFRPSDPSSYGYQTNAVPPSRSMGPNNMSQITSPPFETVFIVNTSPPEPFSTSPKCRTVMYKPPSPVQWTHDCLIEVSSVGTLPSSDAFPSESCIVSPRKETSLTQKKQNAFVREVEGNRSELTNVEKRHDDCTTLTVVSSSPDVVVIKDDDSGDESSPPLPSRNSLPPKPTYPNSSPPNLQASLSAPTLPSFSNRTAVEAQSKKTTVAESIPVITLDSPETSASSENTLESDEMGSKYEESRRLKKERLNKRLKAKRQMEKLQIEYLKLKVKTKAMKLSLITKKMNER